MSPFPSSLLCGIALMLTVIQPSHADLEWKPLSLAKRGKFIELQPGEFVRTSSIVKVSGKIELSARPKSPKSGMLSTGRSFPLSLDGIKELKSAGRTSLIGEFERPEVKVDDFEFQLNVGIWVNGHGMDLLLINGKDFPESWDEVEKKLMAAVESLDRLLALASEDEQATQPAGEKLAQ